jgi:protein-tyrosine phosphatase
MLDLHCHMLPGIDDGAADLEMALAMARMAAADGIRTVACTPHIYPGMYENTADGIRAAIAVFQAQLDAAGIGLRLVDAAAGQSPAWRASSCARAWVASARGGFLGMSAQPGQLFGLGVDARAAGLDHRHVDAGVAHVRGQGTGGVGERGECGDDGVFLVRRQRRAGFNPPSVCMEPVSRRVEIRPTIAVYVGYI